MEIEWDGERRTADGYTCKTLDATGQEGKSVYTVMMSASGIFIFFPSLGWLDWTCGIMMGGV